MVLTMNMMKFPTSIIWLQGGVVRLPWYLAKAEVKIGLQLEVRGPSIDLKAVPYL